MVLDNYWDTYYNGKNIDSIDKSDNWLARYDDSIYRGKSVLDLGCGAGTNIDFLLRKCDSVSAADFSEPAIKLLRENCEYDSVSVFCFDMREIFPFKDGNYDIVIADLSLHYFDRSETRKILSEINRILKQRGKLMARVHSIRNLPSMHTKLWEDGLVEANGYRRKYFETEELKSLLTEWRIVAMESKCAVRFSKEKHIIEFVAEKY